jgi:hypothetical protein
MSKMPATDNSLDKPELTLCPSYKTPITESQTAPLNPM